jgi:alpha-mannosidase
MRPHPIILIFLIVLPLTQSGTAFKSPVSGNPASGAGHPNPEEHAGYPAGESSSEAPFTFPESIELNVRPFYRSRPDGQPGRSIQINWDEKSPLTAGSISVDCAGQLEVTPLKSDGRGISSAEILLPPGLGVSAEVNVRITLIAAGNSCSDNVKVPAMRHWTVYLYPHSHVDIGYTNTQKNVEILHKTNILQGIKLAEDTRDYPAGARYRWNPEVTWPLERLWKDSSPEQQTALVNAIRDGQLCVDASYVNINTSSCSDEELYQLLRFSREMQQLTGIPMDVFQQVDIPGISWGLVPVMFNQGVRYVMAWPNASARLGHARENIEGRPFWWRGPDGKSRVLFLQPGNYGNSGSMEKGGATGRPWFGHRDPAKVPEVIRTGDADVDFTAQCIAEEKAGNPYDFIVLSWSLWDNCPIDADIPGAVKSWNETHAYPRIIIAGGHEIMSRIEKKWGDSLPVVQGDFTEFWTDGLGTAARQTAMNRNAKERLVQAETLWTMLHPGRPMPRDEFDEAWRYIMLASEHTWCFENTEDPYFQDAIWKVKQSYFREAEERSRMLFDEAIAPAAVLWKGRKAQEGVAVFNTQSWARGGLVILSAAESLPGDRVLDDQGNDVLAQRLSTGELVFQSHLIPPFSSRHYQVVEGKCPLPGNCRAAETKIENGVLRVELSPTTGNIVGLVDLASGRNFADTAVDGGLNAFRWMPGDSDHARPDSVTSIRIAEAGPLVVELCVTSDAPGCRSITRTVRLIDGQSWMEVSNVVDKLPLAEKDGIHFGFAFNIEGGRTRVDIPWGIMEVEADQWPQGNRNWLVMQRWLDVSNDRSGVTWCSLDAPLFQSGSMSANQTGTWNWTRKPWISKLEPSSAVYSWVMNNHWFTNFPLTQDGPVTFRYRVMPHGAFDAAAANRFGLEQSQPLVHVLSDSNPLPESLLTLDNDRVKATILKSTAGGKYFVIRLRSLSDKPETVNLAFPKGSPKTLYTCNALDQPVEVLESPLILPPYGNGNYIVGDR